MRQQRLRGKAQARGLCRKVGKAAAAAGDTSSSGSQPVKPQPMSPGLPREFFRDMMSAAASTPEGARSSSGCATAQRWAPILICLRWLPKPNCIAGMCVCRNSSGCLSCSPPWGESTEPGGSKRAACHGWPLTG